MESQIRAPRATGPSPDSTHAARSLDLRPLRTLLGRIEAQYHPERIWLFGSRARGEARCYCTLRRRGSMKCKTSTKAQGRIPGSGRWQETVSTRPDDPKLVSREQMKDLVGVSNSTVITKALECLSIAPTSQGKWTRATYNHGGSGYRDADVLYYSVSAVLDVREELKRNAQPIADGRFSYETVKFHWKAGN